MLGKFPMRGNKPEHYKRLNVCTEEADRLAIYGAKELFAAFGIKTYYTQAVLAGAMLSDDYDTVVAVTCSQYGKLIADDEPVMTSKGWKRHGDLVVGDEVVAPDGRYVKVTFVHPKGAADREVVFQNGSRIKCHHNHEWVYQSTTGRRKEKCIKTISVAEMERRGLKQKPRNAHKFVLPARSPIQGEEKDLAVPPYVMGVWLGDGSTTKGQICACPDDIAVLDKCREYYPEGSEWAHKDTGVITRSFIGLASDLKAYNLCYQRKDSPKKRIPDEYLTANVEQRLELLAGLIDTDGYQYGADGRFYFTTADETLKDTFEDLISTFGWGVSTVANAPRMSTSGIQGRHVYWRIGFKPSMDIPCVLERKRPTRLSKVRGIGIEAIEHIEPVQGNCITVEGGVYCVGRRMLPTHNSWLLGHCAALMAYNDKKLSVAAANTATTDIIMAYTRQSIRGATPDIKDAIVGETMKKIDRLDSSMSKGRISYARGGYIEALTLGDTFGDLSHNKAVGRGTGYIIDEAAMVSEQALAEIGRRELSSVDGTKQMLVMISNPHQPGPFYDALTEENPNKGTLIVWSDALTAAQEGRWTPEHILQTDFAKKRDTCIRYWLCELPQAGQSMFDTPKVIDAPNRNTYKFLGVDAAYKGKDKIYVTESSLGEIAEVDATVEIEKPGDWVDGVTSNEIADDIARIYHRDQCSYCCVDQGYGVWLIEALAQRGVNVLGINFGAGPTKERVKAKQYAATNAANMRAEMHLDLQDLIESGGLVFTQEAYGKVKDVLPFVTCDRRASGKIAVRPKIEIKNAIGHSPDAFDSVLLSLHALVMYSLTEAVYITE